MKITTKQITISGAILAIMIASQFMKGVSVFITGPIVNLCLIIATLSLGLSMGILLSVIAPVTAYIIMGTPPAYGAIPLLMPTIMFGNIILCVVVSFAYHKFGAKWGLPAGLVVGALFKALFMGAVIAKYLFPSFKNGWDTSKALPPWFDKMSGNMSFATQFIAALIAGVLTFIIWKSIGKYLKNEARDTTGSV